MKTLYLANDKDGNKLRLLMTDQMWQQVRVEQSDSTKLDSNGKQITSSHKILIELGQHPTFFQSIKNFVNALIRIFQQIQKNKPLKSPKETIEERKLICKTCPFNKRKFLNMTCTQCGCIIKSKVVLSTESCPINKW